jgi:hypothetical protein
VGSGFGVLRLSVEKRLRSVVWCVSVTECLGTLSVGKQVEGVGTVQVSACWKWQGEGGWFMVGRY